MAKYSVFSDYSTENDTTVLVKYDDKLIYNTTLNGDGQFKFNIPASQSGFHRLDFIIQQYAKPTTLNQTKETFCTEDIDHLTYLSNSQLDFTPVRNEYRLKIYRTLYLTLRLDDLHLLSEF